MRILGKFEVIEPYPAVFLRDIDSIAFSDLHLGYEGIMAENGVFLPRVQFEKEVEIVKGILEKQRAKRVIINGDIKDEFLSPLLRDYVDVDGLGVMGTTQETGCLEFPDLGVLRKQTR